MIVCNLAWYSVSTSPPAVTDSQGNSPTFATQHATTTGGVRQCLVFFVAPVVGPGHTITVSGTGVYASIQCLAFSGAASSAVLGVESGASAQPALTINTGSITPGAATDLVISGLTFDANNGGTISVDSGLTIDSTVAYSPGNWEGGSIAWLAPGSTSALNPQWNSGNTSNYIATGIATFKAATGSGTSYTINPSGSVAFSGTAPESRIKAFSPSGSFALAGAAAFRRTRAFTPIGSIAFSGSAALVTTAVYVITPSGQVTFAGTAPFVKVKTLFPKGRLFSLEILPSSLSPPGVEAERLPNVF